MPDEAHRYTDAEITELEKRIISVFQEANKTATENLNSYIAKFRKRDKIMRARLKSGEITESEYKGWLAGQVFQGKQWRAKVEQTAETLNNAKVVAQGIINGESDDVFAVNANWQSYQFEKGLGASIGFEVYNPNTVARLLREQPELLPKYKINIPKDLLWNQQEITKQVTAGIILGEPLEKVAKRIRKVTSSDMNNSLTHARTAMTAAQSAGRLEGMKRAQELGIEGQKEWSATLDAHTRINHAFLDGQRVGLNESFHVGGLSIEYPADPKAPPSMIYNCRCTLVMHDPKYPPEMAQRRDNTNGNVISDMSYQDWIKWKVDSGQASPELLKKYQKMIKKGGSK